MQSTIAISTQPKFPVIAAFGAKEFLSCIFDDEAGKFKCVIRMKHRNNEVVKYLGFFDDVEKDLSLHKAGNNRDIGMINVYPRSDEVVECIVDDDRNILFCKAS